MNARRQYLRAAEIAELTGMSIRTIRRWIRDEVFPSIKLGGARLVATTDLEAVLFVPQYKIQKTNDEKDECGEESET